jgi:hypothetical protein
MAPIATNMRFALSSPSLVLAAAQDVGDLMGQRQSIPLSILTSDPLTAPRAAPKAAEPQAMELAARLAFSSPLSGP